MDPFAQAAERASAGDASEQGERQATPVSAGALVLHRGATPEETPVVVDEETGEVYTEPTDLSSDRLAALAHDLRQRIAECQLWASVAEAELTARLDREGKRNAVVGEFDLLVSTPHSRKWDGKQLEATAQDLIDAGAVTAGEIAELVTIEHKVNGRLAASLLDRLEGPAREALANCFHWENGKPKLKVTPVRELTEGER